MPASTKPVPEGFHTITPSLTLRNATQAIEFYKKALGAEEITRMATPDGKIGHAELKIGDSIIFLSDEMPGMGMAKSPQSLGGCTGVLNVYVPDVDRVFERALAAGAKTGMPVADQFWGDRYGTFIDPFGFAWGIGTHVEDVSPAEMDRRAREAFGAMVQKKSA
ncbi:MAG TPA: VOC family protein [Terriglobales bacterium]|nr:VOC family protein [Terriglobales bacterium]